jgi:hypothetical protein
LYDSLLDELEDDVVSNPQEVEELTEKVVDAEEADAELLVEDADVTGIAEADIEAEVEQEADASGDAEESLIEQVENWSDDPVRMYLTQMGEIPLLTRAQEIFLARQIETTRAQFRAKLLECEYVCQQAYKVLARVHRGELPFDRTVQVSVTDRLEKDQILGRLPHNLRTLDVLLKQNKGSEAVGECNAAIEADDTYVKAYLRRAAAYMSMADADSVSSAIRDYSKAKELLGGMPGVAPGGGGGRRQQGRWRWRSSSSSSSSSSSHAREQGAAEAD